METFKCLCCDVPMELVDKKTVQNSFKKKFRQRRFKCPVCDYSETIYGDGWRDTKLVEKTVDKDVEEYFKQQGNE